jgi:ferredoxin-NADP reductase
VTELGIVRTAKSKKQPWQKAVILAVEPRTPRIRSFFLAPERPFSYVAGQYVKVRLTAEDGYTAERSYSIASAPESGAVIELAIEELPGGEVSGYFHDTAAVGDTLEIRGPLGGHFIWSAADGGPILLIGGGSGLVPLMSMIRHRAAQKSTASMGLIHSAITWDDVLYRDELLELADAKTGFELMLTLTRELPPPSRLDVAARRVDSAMVEEMLGRLPAAVSGVFICGSNPFVENAANAVTALGVEPKIVRTERYGE